MAFDLYDPRNRLSYDRIVQILQLYINCEVVAASEIQPILNTLKGVCGMTRDEAELVGLGYLFDVGDEDEIVD